MRDLRRVVEDKQSRLQELQREIQRLEGQLEVLRPALRVLEEDEAAGEPLRSGQTLPDPKTLRRWPEPVASSAEKAAAGEKGSTPKQFP